MFQPIRSFSRSMSGWGARGEYQRGGAGIEVREIADMVGEYGAPHAGTAMLNTGRSFRMAVHTRIEECAVDDQLTPPVEQVRQAHRPFRPLEDVWLVHGDPRHPPTLRGKRVARVGHLLFFDEQSLPLILPLLRRHNARCCHRHIPISIVKFDVSVNRR
jgi:hypothetical protein